MKKKQKWIVDWDQDTASTNLTWFVYQEGTFRYLLITGVVVDWNVAMHRYGVDWINQKFQFATKKLAEAALKKYLNCKYGWVLDLKSGYEKSETPKYSYCDCLRDAWIFRTRAEAREEKRDNEVVRKVELFKNGRPKKIVLGR